MSLTDISVPQYTKGMGSYFFSSTVGGVSTTSANGCGCSFFSIFEAFSSFFLRHLNMTLSVCSPSLYTTGSTFFSCGMGMGSSISHLPQACLTNSLYSLVALRLKSSNSARALCLNDSKSSLAVFGLAGCTERLSRVTVAKSVYLCAETTLLLVENWFWM